MAVNLFDIYLPANAVASNSWGPTWQSPGEVPLGGGGGSTRPREVTVVVLFGSDTHADLRRTIDSVRFQTLAPSEILVVDDGRHTAAVTSIRSLPGVRGIDPPARNAAMARNHALLMARHELLAFLTAGDEWPVDALAGQVSALEADPSIDVVLGQVRGRALERTAAQELCFHLGSTLIRRSVFSRVGLFHEGHPLDALEWLMRVREIGLHVVCREAVTLWTSGRERRDIKRKSFLELEKLGRR